MPRTKRRSTNSRKPIYPKASLTERLMDWIDELLYRLVVEGSSVPGGWFTISVLLILLVVADRGGGPGCPAHHAHQPRRRPRAVRRRMSSAPPSTARPPNSMRRQGNWSAAIRHRLRAVARQLEESGVLNPVPGRTATELARDAGGRYRISPAN